MMMIEVKVLMILLNLQSLARSKKGDLPATSNCFNLALSKVNTYLETYERTLSGFEAAALKDTCLNVVEEVQKMIKLFNMKKYKQNWNKGGGWNRKKQRRLERREEEVGKVLGVKFLKYLRKLVANFGKLRVKLYYLGHSFLVPPMENQLWRWTIMRARKERRGRMWQHEVSFKAAKMVWVNYDINKLFVTAMYLDFDLFGTKSARKRHCYLKTIHVLQLVLTTLAPNETSPRDRESYTHMEWDMEELTTK
ncbi:hypothetical protein CTI12_AA187490 [Artemisia annua]|uniref:Uncharacterized protein n=1 Tax=Artemisia annua TaxID=35608 RepID=A0A2U1P1U2_ARTAN|nr:hypothetical protein CTI12_AA187490 [Artemisia annua]